MKNFDTEKNKDFRNKNLSGKSFRNKNLSGADFSFSNIKGTDFSFANLEDCSFEGVQAGIKNKTIQIYILLLLVVYISAFSIVHFITYGISESFLTLETILENFSFFNTQYSSDSFLNEKISVLISTLLFSFSIFRYFYFSIIKSPLKSNLNFFCLISVLLALFLIDDISFILITSIPAIYLVASFKKEGLEMNIINIFDISLSAIVSFFAAMKIPLTVFSDNLLKSYSNIITSFYDVIHIVAVFYLYFAVILILADVLVNFFFSFVKILNLKYSYIIIIYLASIFTIYLNFSSQNIGYLPVNFDYKVDIDDSLIVVITYVISSLYMLFISWLSIRKFDMLNESKSSYLKLAIFLTTRAFCTKFIGAKLDNVEFKDAKLTNCNFKNSSACDFSPSTNVKFSVF